MAPVDPSASRPPPEPPAYAGRVKYDAARALRYEARSAARHAEEWDVVTRLLDDVPAPATVFDAPCGTGRIAAEWLARGARVRLGDWSPDMLERARARVGDDPRVAGFERVDLEAPPAADAPKDDLVICLRFFHHLPDDARRRAVLRTLKARARDVVIVSFHHRVSLHQLARALRRVVTGRRGDRHATTVRRLAELAREEGLVLEKTAATARYLRDFWAARLRVRA